MSVGTRSRKKLAPAQFVEPTEPIIQIRKHRKPSKSHTRRGRNYPRWRKRRRAHRDRHRRVYTPSGWKSSNWSTKTPKAMIDVWEEPKLGKRGILAVNNPPITELPQGTLIVTSGPTLNSNNIEIGVSIKHSRRQCRLTHKRLRRRKLKIIRHRKLAAANLTVATCNVITLNNPDKNEDLALRLHKAGIQIVAIQETKLLQNIETLEIGTEESGYLLYCSGNPIKKVNGVAIAIKRNLDISIDYIERKSDRIMFIDYTDLMTQKEFRIISIYAPTSTYTYSVKKNFYEQLSTALTTERQMIWLGDFNARVNCQESNLHPALMGKFGSTAATNENGELLLQFCATNLLSLVNTRFKASSLDGYNTWYHRRSKLWFMIDYAITNQNQLHLVRRCSVNKRYSDVEGKDHLMVTLVIYREATTSLLNTKKKRVEPLRAKLRTGPLAGEFQPITGKLNKTGFIYDSTTSGTHNKRVRYDETLSIEENAVIAEEDNSRTRCRDAAGRTIDNVIDTIAKEGPALSTGAQFDRIIKEVNLRILTDKQLMDKPNKLRQLTNRRHPTHSMKDDLSSSPLYEKLENVQLRITETRERLHLLGITQCPRQEQLLTKLKRLKREKKRRVSKIKVFQHREINTGINKLITEQQTKKVADMLNRIASPIANKGNTPIAFTNEQGESVKDLKGKTEIGRLATEKLLNQVPTSNISIDTLGPSKEVQAALAYHFTAAELAHAINHIPLGKAGGTGYEDKAENDTTQFISDLDIEVIKYAQTESLQTMTLEMMNSILHGGEIPQSWLDADVILLYKKGDPKNVDNYRTLTLNSMFYKIFTRIITVRIQMYCEEHHILPEAQHGFRIQRGCNDANSILNTIRGQAYKFGIDIYAAFIDIAKAYDSVDRVLLWKILAHIGIPPQLVTVIKRLYDESRCCIFMDGERSAWFSTSIGLKQGCPLSCLLFLIYFSTVGEAIKKEMTIRRNTPLGIKFKSVFTDKVSHPRGFDQQFGLVNLDRDQVISWIHELLFADDAVVLAYNQIDLQTLMIIYNQIFARFGLRMALQKTEVMLFRNSDRALLKDDEGNFVLNDTDIHLKDRDNNIILNPNGTIFHLPVVNKFKYLGNMVYNIWDNNDVACSRAIAIARSSYDRLTNLYSNKLHDRFFKILHLRTVIMKQLDYGIETWVLKTEMVKKLNSFMYQKLREILGIHHKARISLNEILQFLHANNIKLYPFEIYTAQRRLMYYGRVQRLETFRLVKRVHNGCLCPPGIEGPYKVHKSRAGPTTHTRSADFLFEDLALLNITPDESKDCQSELVWELRVTTGAKKAFDFICHQDLLRREATRRLATPPPNTNNLNQPDTDDLTTNHPNPLYLITSKARKTLESRLKPPLSRKDLQEAKLYKLNDTRTLEATADRPERKERDRDITMDILRRSGYYNPIPRKFREITSANSGHPSDHPKPTHYLKYNREYTARGLTNPYSDEFKVFSTTVTLAPYIPSEANTRKYSTTPKGQRRPKVLASQLSAEQLTLCCIAIQKKNKLRCTSKKKIGTDYCGTHKHLIPQIVANVMAEP
jgi:exonuclease III